ncbi:MAG: phytoene desaturase [Alphaproteobacteria bacterium]
MDQKIIENDDDRRAIVIGAGLGGLASAMRLGAKGYAVEVFDRLDQVGGRGSSITQSGYRFDLGPTIITVPQLFEDLWSTCGFRFEDNVKLISLDPFYQIRWPDGSCFTASADTDRMIEEVRKLSPADVKGYKRFLKDSEVRYRVGFEDLGRRPMNSLWELIKVLPRFAWLRADRSVVDHVSLRVRDPRLQMALSFHPLFIGGNPSKVTSMYSLVSYLEKTFGVHYAIGGVQAIADAMKKVILRQGGQVHLNTTVDEILVEDDMAVSGIRLEDGRHIRSKVVVSNADAGFTYRNLLRNVPKKRWSEKKLQSQSWSMGLFVWYFATRQTAECWKDVGHHTILNGPRYQGLVDDIFIRGKLSDDMSLYIHRPSVSDPTVAPHGDDVFYVLSPVPHLGHDKPVNWVTERERYRQKVAAQLQTIIPGFEENIVESLILDPESFEQRYLSPLGCGFSLEPRILQSAWFRPHNISEECKGLFLTGAGTHPGAGVPGVISSAEVLAQLVPALPAWDGQPVNIQSWAAE